MFRMSFNLSYLTSGIKLCSVGIFASNPTTTKRQIVLIPDLVLGFYKDPHLLDSFSPFLFLLLSQDLINFTTWFRSCYFDYLELSACCILCSLWYLYGCCMGRAAQTTSFQFRGNAGLVLVRWNSLKSICKVLRSVFTAIV